MCNALPLIIWGIYNLNKVEYNRRIKKYEYYTGGTIGYIHDEKKEVIIDGETYTNTKSEWVDYDLDKSFEERDQNGKWELVTYDLLSCYGIIIKEWKCTKFNPVCEIKNIYEYAFNCGDIPKYKISRISYGKFDVGFRNWEELINHHLKYGVFTFIIRGYGWGNSISIEMPIKYFIQLPFSQHDIDYQGAIERLYNNDNFDFRLPLKYFKRPLSEVEKIELAISIFKHKIKLKKRNR